MYMFWYRLNLFGRIKFYAYMTYLIAVNCRRAFIEDQGSIRKLIGLKQTRTHTDPIDSKVYTFTSYCIGAWLIEDKNGAIIKLIGQRGLTYYVIAAMGPLERGIKAGKLELK